MALAQRTSRSSTLTEDLRDFLAQRKDPLLGTNIDDLKRTERFKDVPDHRLTCEVIRMAFKGQLKMRLNHKGEWRAWLPRYFTDESQSLPGRAYVPTLVYTNLDEIDWEHSILQTILQTGSLGITSKLLNDIYWSQMELVYPQLENKTLDYIENILKNSLESPLVLLTSDDFWIHTQSLTHLDQDQILTLLTLKPLARLILTELLLDSKNGVSFEEIISWARKNLLLDRDDHLEVAWALKSLKSSRLVHSDYNSIDQQPVKVWKFGAPAEESFDDQDSDEEARITPLEPTTNIELTVSLDQHFKDIQSISVRLKGTKSYLPIALPLNASVKIVMAMTEPNTNPRLVVWDNVEELLITNTRNFDEKHFAINGPIGIQID